MNYTNKMRYFLDFLWFTFALVLLLIILSGGFELEVGGLHVRAYSVSNPILFVFILSCLRFILYGLPQRIQRITDCFVPCDFFKKDVYEEQLLRISICHFFVSAISVILVKTFVFFVSHLFFNESPTLSDLIYSFTSDFALLFIFACLMFLAWTISYKINFIFILRAIRLLLTLIFVSLLAFIFFNILSGLVYYEWGAFLESHHILAMKHAGVQAEFMDLLYRKQTALLVSIYLVLLLLVYLSYKVIESHSLAKLCTVLCLILFPFSLASLVPINNPEKFSPLVPSPLLMLTAEIDDNTDGVPPELLAGISSKDFVIETEGKSIAPSYDKLKGTARGMNVIFYVLESVRQKNIDLYGYPRKTMPTLSQLANNSIVFHNTYIHQPRSCKTLAAITLGVAPDPRLRALSWRSHTLSQADSLLKRLLDQEYKLYLGVNQLDFGGDGFFQFVQQLSDKRISRAIDRTKLDPADNFRINGDDRKLVKDFLHWSKEQKSRYVSILWTSAAHMPYKAPEQPFGKRSKIDQYDNCLYSADLGLQYLVKGLKDQGRLENTLVVILGDHGEAVYDKLDWGHGNFLYDHSLRVPFVIYNPHILPQRKDFYPRFQVKDIPATLLYLLGLPEELGQSENIFLQHDKGDLYFSNVFRDFKLGFLYDNFKFVYRPKYDLTYLYDLTGDPDENNNVVGRLSPEKVADMKKNILTWYKYQLNYINTQYPPK